MVYEATPTKQQTGGKLMEDGSGERTDCIDDAIVSAI
jgi:hypothetical protein